MIFSSPQPGWAHISEHGTDNSSGNEEDEETVQMVERKRKAKVNGPPGKKRRKRNGDSSSSAPRSYIDSGPASSITPNIRSPIVRSSIYDESAHQGSASAPSSRTSVVDSQEGNRVKQMARKSTGSSVRPVFRKQPAGVVSRKSTGGEPPSLARSLPSDKSDNFSDNIEDDPQVNGTLSTQPHFVLKKLLGQTKKAPPNSVGGQVTASSDKEDDHDSDPTSTHHQPSPRHSRLTAQKSYGGFSAPRVLARKSTGGLRPPRSPNTERRSTFGGVSGLLKGKGRADDSSSSGITSAAGTTKRFRRTREEKERRGRLDLDELNSGNGSQDGAAPSISGPAGPSNDRNTRDQAAAKMPQHEVIEIFSDDDHVFNNRSRSSRDQSQSSESEIQVIGGRIASSNPRGNPQPNSDDKTINLCSDTDEAAENAFPGVAQSVSPPIEIIEILDSDDDSLVSPSRAKPEGKGMDTSIPAPTFRRPGSRLSGQTNMDTSRPSRASGDYEMPRSTDVSAIEEEGGDKQKEKLRDGGGRYSSDKDVVMDLPGLDSNRNFDVQRIASGMTKESEPLFINGEDDSSSDQSMDMVLELTMNDTIESPVENMVQDPQPPKSKPPEVHDVSPGPRLVELLAEPDSLDNGTPSRLPVKPPTAKVSGTNNSGLLSLSFEEQMTQVYASLESNSINSPIKETSVHTRKMASFSNKPSFPPASTLASNPSITVPNSPIPLGKNTARKTTSLPRMTTENTPVKKASVHARKPTSFSDKPSFSSAPAPVPNSSFTVSKSPPSGRNTARKTTSLPRMTTGNALIPPPSRLSINANSSPVSNSAGQRYNEENLSKSPPDSRGALGSKSGGVYPISVCSSVSPTTSRTDFQTNSNGQHKKGKERSDMSTGSSQGISSREHTAVPQAASAQLTVFISPPSTVHGALNQKGPSSNTHVSRPTIPPQASGQHKSQSGNSLADVYNSLNDSRSSNLQSLAATFDALNVTTKSKGKRPGHSAGLQRLLQKSNPQGSTPIPAVHKVLSVSQLPPDPLSVASTTVEVTAPGEDQSMQSEDSINEPTLSVAQPRASPRIAHAENVDVTGVQSMSSTHDISHAMQTENSNDRAMIPVLQNTGPKALGASCSWMEEELEYADSPSPMNQDDQDVSDISELLYPDTNSEDPSPGNDTPAAQGIDGTTSDQTDAPPPPMSSPPEPPEPSSTDPVPQVPVTEEELAGRPVRSRSSSSGAVSLRRSHRISRDRSMDTTSAGVTPNDTPPRSPSPEDIPRIFGGFPVMTWESYRQNLRNSTPEYYRACDLPHKFQDHINSMSATVRNFPKMREVFEIMVAEANSRDEPDAPPILLENSVDDEPAPPWEFYYTNKMWLGENVPPPSYKNLKSCGCIGKCDPKSKTCACLKRQHQLTGFYQSGFLYEKHGLLKQPGIPIFECNSLCGCDEDCINRVVQNGRKCEVKVGKTSEKGWGVFNGSKWLPKGTFIGIYAGELLADAVAEERGKKYNSFGRTYLFDIDFYHIREMVEGWSTSRYTVDAYHAGNFTRFLNHSCDPNAALTPVYIDEDDWEKPLLTIFTKRAIQPNEEISFSYGGDPDHSDEESVPSPPKKGKAKAKTRATPISLTNKVENDAVYSRCRCGSWRCKGTMFGNADGNDEDYHDEG